MWTDKALTDEIFAFGALFLGMLVPLQTAANARMRRAVGSPLAVTFLSFALSSLLLIAFSVMGNIPILPTAGQMEGVPWWGWLGGVIALFTITVTMVLFRILGPVQTSILPLLGQLLFSLVIDHFGLFGMAQIPLVPLRAAALFLVTGGVLLAIAPVRGKGKEMTPRRGSPILLWQLTGIAAGCLMASIGAIYGMLGTLLGSAVQASALSFLMASLVMLPVCIGSGSLSFLHRAFAGGHPWWMWLGGVCGAAAVFGNAWLLPRTGAGAFFMALLLGQVSLSLLLEARGWLDSPKRQITGRQCMGLILMTAGVAAIRFH